MGSAFLIEDLRGSFLRVYGEIDDTTNKELDQVAILKGSNKKLLVADAIDLYLHQDRSELDLAIKERDQLTSEQDLICCVKSKTSTYRKKIRLIDNDSLDLAVIAVCSLLPLRV
jgi:hypothetical protein